jgi:Fe-Mn family superoxide dismutase
MFAAQRLRRDILRRCPRVDPLAYPPNALEPHIDALTVEIHHDRHHQACVTNLNNFAYEHPQIAAKPIAEVLGNLDNFRGT